MSSTVDRVQRNFTSLSLRLCLSLSLSLSFSLRLRLSLSLPLSLSLSTSLSLSLSLSVYVSLSLSLCLIKDRKFPCVRSVRFHGDGVCVTAQGKSTLLSLDEPLVSTDRPLYFWALINKLINKSYAAGSHCSKQHQHVNTSTVRHPSETVCQNISNTTRPEPGNQPLLSINLTKKLLSFHF